MLAGAAVAAVVFLGEVNVPVAVVDDLRAGRVAERVDGAAVPVVVAVLSVYSVLFVQPVVEESAFGCFCAEDGVGEGFLETFFELVGPDRTAGGRAGLGVFILRGAAVDGEAQLDSEGYSQN